MLAPTVRHFASLPPHAQRGRSRGETRRGRRRRLDGVSMVPTSRALTSGLFTRSSSADDLAGLCIDPGNGCQTPDARSKMGEPGRRAHLRPVLESIEIDDNGEPRVVGRGAARLAPSMPPFVSSAPTNPAARNGRIFKEGSRLGRGAPNPYACKKQGACQGHLDDDDDASGVTARDGWARKFTVIRRPPSGRPKAWQPRRQHTSGAEEHPAHFWRGDSAARRRACRALTPRPPTSGSAALARRLLRCCSS
jgi:hypothetical protein